MPFTTPAAYGIYPHNAPVNDVVSTLNHAGFANENICMMVSPTHPMASIVREASFDRCDRQASTATAGLIGWFSEFGAVMIPTVGFFIRSQAFFRALFTAQNAPGICGNSATLAGLGFPDDDAARFERELRQSGVLVYVTCSETAKTGWARELLRRTGAREAATLEPDTGVEMKFSEMLSA